MKVQFIWYEKPYSISGNKKSKIIGLSKDATSLL